MTGRIDITPATKVGALLSDRPELEETLIGMAPEFARLRNPILRRTVGRIATLAKAARMADLDPVVLVGRLRAAAGLPPLAAEVGVTGETGGARRADPETAGPAESWIEEVEVREELEVDADALLEAGESPLTRIRSAVAVLEPGQAVRIRSSFLPVPLLEALGKDARVRVATRRQGNLHETFVARR